MKCKEFQNNILFYIEGDLDKRFSKEFEWHLEVCNHCMQLFKKVADNYSLLANDKITESNPFFFTRVEAAIASGKENRNISILSSTKGAVLQWVTYLIIGVFALFIGYLIAKDQDYVVQETIQNQYEKSDEELFADSHYLNFSAENLYVVANSENEDKE